MMKIGIVSCDKWINQIREDILLSEYLKIAGYETELVSWEDKTIDYTEYTSLILRSVWGYQNNYEEFKKWLLYIKRINIKLYNDVEIILNNIRKDKQFEILDKHNIPHIPTKFVYSIKDFENIKTNNVVKPIISGSGENTYKVSSEINGELREKLEKIISLKDNGIMIQPYLNSIENGEYSCIFIGKANTHNMLRYPGVFFEKRKPKIIKKIPYEVISLAKRINQLEEFCNCLYMRADIVYYGNNPVVMELELAEPDLLIKYIEDETLRDETLKRFVKEIGRRL